MQRGDLYSWQLLSFFTNWDPAAFPLCRLIGPLMNVLTFHDPIHYARLCGLTRISGKGIVFLLVIILTQVTEGRAPVFVAGI